MSMSNEVGRVSLGIDLDSRSAEQQAGSLGTALQNKFGILGSKLGRTLLKGLSVAAITKFGKKCLELGSDLTEVQNVVDTVFPSMSSQKAKIGRASCRERV